MRSTVLYCFVATLVPAMLTGTASAAPLAGAVLDGQTLEPIQGATVTVAGTELQATTDAAGAYRFADVPPGPVQIQLEADGYVTSTETYALGGDGAENAVFVMLPPGVYAEVIEIQDQAPPLPAPPGKTDLRREELTRIPGTRGDALTSIKSLPGVANVTGSGPGPLVIRGAAPEDSKVIIDGIEIPILYHFFGLQSIVPSELISAIDFLPGGFGTEEGRSTGGVISVLTRAEVIEQAKGFAELSFINFAGFIETPLSRRHNLQLTAGIRRSAIDLVLPAVLPEDASVSFTTAPRYYDAQVRVDWRPKYAHRLTLLGLVSFDLLTLLNDTINPNEPLLSGKFENQTSFTRTLLTWQYSEDKVENRLVAAVGTTGVRFEIGADRYLNLEQQSLEIRDDATWKLGPRLAMRAGLETRYIANHIDIRFPLPPQEGMGGVPGNFSTAPLVERMEDFNNSTSGAYLAADFRPIPGTVITPGLRLEHFYRYEDTLVMPRVSAQQALGRGLDLRLALGLYSRQPEQAEALQASLDPELATHYVAGLDYQIAPGLTTQVSGFYTDRRALVVQDPNLAATDPASTYINRGVGRSFGGELLLRAKRDRFFGWIAYTLSRSDRVDGPASERRLFDFDQTHNLIMVGSYTLGSWELGGRWQYNTGTPETPIVGSQYLSDVNIYVPVLGEPNSRRLDASHQLDLRIDRRWTFTGWSLSAYLDITNVYAHPRTLGYRYNFDYSQRAAITELPLVPAVGLRGSF